MLCVIPGLTAAALTAASPCTPDTGARWTAGFPAKAGTHRSAAGASASMGPRPRRDLILKLPSASFRFRLRRHCREQVELPRQARRHRDVEVAIGDLGQHAAARRAL